VTNKSHTAYCDFGNGVSCTVTYEISEDKRMRPTVQWVGQRTPQMFPVYMEWIHSVNSIISKAAGTN